jgi:uncharacterized membrane protein
MAAPIDWGVVARAVHVVAVVVWIGGVGLVTTVLLPSLAKKPPEAGLNEFAAIERRFAPQARIAVLLVLLSGLYMLYEYDLWDRFADAAYWWMDLMVAVWVIFAAMLFVIEPLLAGPYFHRQARVTPETALARMLWFHRIVLELSLLAVFAAVGGSHGLF